MLNNITRKKGTFFAVLAITLIFGYISFFGLDLAVFELKGADKMRFGIDIRGGVDAAFKPAGVDLASVTAEDLESARSIIETRLDQQNILDRDVTIDKTQKYIFVRFPWKTGETDFDPGKAIEELGQMARLTFRDEEGNVVVEGKNVTSAKVERDTDHGGWMVAIQFNAEGTKEFASATSALINKPMGIYMDENEISAPTVQSAITGGAGVITGGTGGFKIKEAQTLANQINGGKLPFALNADNFNVISPQLGSNALGVMVQAALVAFVIICVLLIFYYRLSGVIAAIALILQVAGQLIMLTWPQFTITLPGIAGIILAIGMGVDANVIASERIREEIRSGKNIEASVAAGFKNAFSSIFDGNITVLVVAAVMLVFGSGAILSFAYTLLFGIIMNFVAGVTATRLMTMSIIQNKALRNPRWFLSQRAETKKPWKISFTKWRKVYYAFSLAIIAVGIIFTVVRGGITLDIQFSGGAIFQYEVSDEHVPNPDEAANYAAEFLPGRSFSGQITENFVTKNQMLVLNLAGESIDQTQMDQLTAHLREKYPESEIALEQSNNVSPFFGQQFLRNGVIAIILSFVLIIVYVAFSFRKIHGLSAGVMGLLSLFHDVTVAFFVFSIFQIPVGDTFIAVALTILGYSINDTIVIYDRIRENTLKKDFTDVNDLVDKSISQSFTRSLNTNLAVFISVAVLWVFAAANGLDSITSFAFPMAIGTLSGCYSTVCIAGPTWALWRGRKQS